MDVEFIDLVEYRRRQVRRANILRALAVCLMALAGFLFFPTMIMWLAGEDITVNIAESLADGFYLPLVFHSVLNTLMGIVAGFIGIALLPRIEE